MLCPSKRTDCRHTPQMLLLALLKWPEGRFVRRRSQESNPAMLAFATGRPQESAMEYKDFTMLCRAIKKHMQMFLISKTFQVLCCSVFFLSLRKDST